MELLKTPLTIAESIFLKVYRDTKAAYRRDAFAYEANRPGIAPMPTYEAIQTGLVAKGLLRQDKRGICKPVLDYDEIGILLAYQNDTAESLAQSLVEANDNLAAARESYAKVAHLTRWPESERRDNEAAIVVGSIA